MNKAKGWVQTITAAATAEYMIVDKTVQGYKVYRVKSSATKRLIGGSILLEYGATFGKAAWLYANFKTTTIKISVGSFEYVSFSKFLK